MTNDNNSSAIDTMKGIEKIILDVLRDTPEIKAVQLRLAYDLATKYMAGKRDELFTFHFEETFKGIMPDPDIFGEFEPNNQQHQYIYDCLEKKIWRLFSNYMAKSINEFVCAVINERLIFNTMLDFKRKIIYAHFGDDNEKLDKILRESGETECSVRRQRYNKDGTYETVYEKMEQI